MAISATALKRVCSVCGNLGKEDGCPKCGMTPRALSVNKMLTLDIPADVIPIPYQGKLWDRPIAQDISLKFKEFDSALERVVQEFHKGRIPYFSMFIAAPPKYGKQGFAYACMQLALVQKFSIAPLFSTADWRRLYRVSQVNPFYKLFGQYQWDDLVSRDVVFITLDHSDERFDVIGLMKDILDVRSRLGKSTFFVSDYKLEDLVRTWGGDDYNLIFNSDPERDFARYPVIIQRF